MTHRRWTVPLSVAVVVAGVVLLALWLARGGSTTNVGSSAGPHVLHLSSSGTAATAMSSSAADETTPGSDPYKLVGPLPSGTPTDQPLWHLPSASAADAQSVADALQLPGTPTRVKGGWALRDGANRLIVRDDGNWSYGTDCSPDTPIADENIDVGCAVASSAAVTGPDSNGPELMPTYPPGPTDSDARAVAGGVFDRLGMTDPAIAVYDGDPTSTVQASPTVDGLRSAGWMVSVQVDGSSAVTSADGWLMGPQRGADYPVISAHAAFDLLQKQPRPMLMLCKQRTDGQPGCADIPPTEITGATLGVMLDRDNGAPVLVPAWLFSVKGQDEPLAQIAVDPSYLGPPPTPPAIEPAQPPMSVEPAPPVDEPSRGGISSGRQ